MIRSRLPVGRRGWGRVEVKTFRREDINRIIYFILRTPRIKARREILFSLFTCMMNGRAMHFWSRKRNTSLQFSRETIKQSSYTTPESQVLWWHLFSHYHDTLRKKNQIICVSNLKQKQNRKPKNLVNERHSPPNSI